MAVITIGNDPVNRSYQYGGWTAISKDGPADGDGLITEARIYVNVQIVNTLELATFIDEGSNVLSTRDTEGPIASTYAAGYHEIVVELDVITNDYFGMFCPNPSKLDTASSGEAGLWYKVSDEIPASSFTFTWLANFGISLEGVGATAPTGVSIPIAMHHYKQMQENN